MLKTDPLPPTPSLMAQRLSHVSTTSSPPPTAAVASAPKTRPFEIRAPPAPLYSSSTESWSHSRPNAQTAPSRPPKIYDAPPPSINYRPAMTPERQASFDSNHLPSIPPKTTLEGRTQRPLEVRQPSPPSLSPSLSPSTEQTSHRASAIFPPAPQLAEIKPSSPFEVQAPALPRRPSRPFEIEPSPERERRPSRPFEVRAAPNPLNLASEKRESPRPFDIPFRSPIHFPSVSSERPSRDPSPAPRPALTLADRKASTPTFEFEPPIQRSEPSTEVSPTAQPTPVDTWTHHKNIASPAAQPTAVDIWNHHKDVESPPSSPKSKPVKPALVEPIRPPALEDIKPPPGPPPAKHKGKKSVSFAARDSLISPTSYGPQSPFSDDSQLPPDSPSSTLNSPGLGFTTGNRDSDQSLTELPIFLKIDDQDLTPRPTPAPDSAQAGPSSAPKVPLSPRSLPPLEIPPPPGPPPTVQQVSKPEDEGMDFDAAVAQLVDYGFTAEEAQRGLLENGSGVDVQAAANWLLDESNQPEPPPLPKRPGSEPQELEPPSPLSPSDDASSDLYEAEPVSPVSLASGVIPRLNASRVPASQRYSMVFPEDPELLPPRAFGAQPPSPPSEKKDSSSFETYRPSSSSTNQAPPSPPSSKAPSLEQEQADVVAQLPSYSKTDPRDLRAPFPNPLHSHPVQVQPYRPKETPHKIPRKKVPLPSLDTQVSNESSSSGSSAPLGSANVPLSAIGAGIAASLVAASGPAAPSVKPTSQPQSQPPAAQDFTPVSAHHSTTSSMSSITSPTMSPGSATNPLKAPKKDKSASSKGWGSRFAQISQKANKGFTNLANKVNTAGFVGETVEKECEKAARILRAFCKHGVYANPTQPPTPAAEGPSPGGSMQALQPTTSKGEKKLVRIPPELIQKAVGLAIFTTLRVGLGLGESTGSGIVIARLHDGSWSAPSAISLQSFGAGVAAGVDIFDCVCVINTQEALGAFMNTRFSLGAGVAVAAGPWGTGRSVEWGSMHNKDRGGKKSSISSDDDSPPPALQLNDEPLAIQEPKPRRRGSTVTLEPVYSYVKSKGLFAGFSYEGNVVNERKEANTRFYGEPVTVEQILRGHARAPGDSEALATLREALLAAEDYDPHRGSVGGVGIPPSIQEEGVMDGDEQPEQTWPKDVKPKFPEDSLHPAEAYYGSRVGQGTYISP